MQYIGYKKWAYIPVDSEPTDNVVTTWNPPVLTNIALDANSSLIVDFSKDFFNATILIKTTAFSSPVDPNSSLKILFAEQGDSFKMIDNVSWNTLREGSFVINKSDLQSNMEASLLKIFYTGPTIIVNSINFEVINPE